MTPSPTELTRPIIGIENRTAQEVFDIMCDRTRSALVSAPAVPDAVRAEAEELLRNATYEDGQATVLTQDCEALEAALAASPAPVPDAVERAAKAMCMASDEDWDASSSLEAANGCEPEDMRQYWRDMAHIAINKAAALSHPAPDRAVEALREFAQFVADYSNDPHVVKEAHKHLAASTGEANHG